MKQKIRGPKPVVSPARAAAFDILLRVERDSSYASELLHSRIASSLSAVDHSLATELVMGVLRWQSVIDSQISQSSSQPLAKLDLEILIALRLAIYQFIWLNRIPARAAINESVELVKRARKRSAASFVNAVLRKSASSRPSSPQVIDGSSLENLAATSSHPLWLVERWWNTYGQEAVFQICQQDQCPPVTAIRLRHPEAEARLIEENIELAPGSIVAFARRVVNGDVTKSSAYKSSLCVIQDEGSQLVALLAGQGDRILDCCAAPGGKTSVLADRNPGSHINAVELHPHRARLLQKLLQAGNSVPNNISTHIRVIAADARALPFATKFDRVLADMPCSGTGTLSRNPEIKWRLTPKDITDLQARQLAILRSAMQQVHSGGRIIYSTCSLEREENEDVINKVLAEDSSFHVVDCANELKRLQSEGELVCEDISSLISGQYLRTLPGVHPCDGFFAAILERN